MKPAIKIVLIAGIVCLAAPLAGLLFTVIGMISAFHDLGNAGISDPKALADHIGMTLTGTMAGLVVGMIGLIAVVVALIIHFATKPAPAAPIQ